MQVRLCNKRNNPKLNAYVHDRLELVIGRFEDRIGHVDIRLLDENDGKGGPDKICTIDIKLNPRGQLHVRAKNADMYAAVVKAVHRAESVLAKTIQRGHRGRDIRHRRGNALASDRDAVNLDFHVV